MTQTPRSQRFPVMFYKRKRRSPWLHDIENARQSPCALSGNISPYNNTVHIKLCAYGVLLVFWRAYRGSKELMDEELSCWSRGKM